MVEIFSTDSSSLGNNLKHEQDCTKFQSFSIPPQKNDQQTRKTEGGEQGMIRFCEEGIERCKQEHRSVTCGDEPSSLTPAPI